MWQRYLLSYLRNHLNEAKSKNPSFSLRSFALKLGISPGMLSEILNELRPITLRTAKKIVDKIVLSEEEKSRLLHMMEDFKPQTRMLLPEEAFEFASHWYYPAILCLFDLDHPPKSKEEVAQKLNLDQATCEHAVDRLLEFGFLIADQNHHLQSSRQHFTTTEDIPNQAFQQALSENLERAKLILRNTPVDQRELTSVTFDGSTESLVYAKDEIRFFRDKMVSVMQGPTRDTVYALNIQLVPLTTPHKEITTHE